MIRRGLQFACLWMFLLGAAPSFGQHPSSITLQDFTNSAWNGYYVQIGTLDPSNQAQPVGTHGPTLFQRYSVNGQPASVYVTVVRNNLEDFLGIHTNYPTLSHQEFRVARSALRTDSSAPYTGFYLMSGGAAIAGAALVDVPMPDLPYQQAFPDWEAAGVKIPLGFTFGMSVWAAFLAATIALKWVRELSSAAT